MAALQYRIVTNWPASMKEDFVFAPTEDRNAHYDLVVEILSCIADEKNPERFRIVEETTYEYDIQMPREPSVPRMPVPTGELDGDAEFIELCRRYALVDSQRLSSDEATLRRVHVANTETYTVEGQQLAEIAALARFNRPEAKFRFILGKYGISGDELQRLSIESRFAEIAAYREIAAGAKDAKKRKKKDKKRKKAKKTKKESVLEKLAKRAYGAKGKKDKKDKKDKKRKKGEKR